MGAGHSVMDDMFTYLVTGAESGGSNFTLIADVGLGPYGGLPPVFDLHQILGEY